ncbi:hypothetical protein UlMin_018956 [Ulmus minor]
MAFVCFLLLGLLVLGGEVSGMVESSDGFGADMEKEELLGLFEVFDALLDDSDWAKYHPQPCSETPWPGVQCEESDESPIFHVTKIHIGQDILNPPCKSSAKLSNSLLKLPYLRTLSAFNCFLTSPVTLSPALFGGLSSLEQLVLQSNPALSGEIPPSLGKLPSLRVLSLSQNNLEGKIPREIGEMIVLEQLDLSYNNLTGEVPEEIGGLENLSILDLSWNTLEGQVPSTLGQLQLLQKIDLGSNRLVGRIPPDLGKLSRLVLLDLSNNFINGPMPETLSGLVHLEYLIAYHNPLNTGVPQFIGQLRNLQTLGLSSCGLTGSLPNSLSSLKHLSALYVDNNSLTGTIPSNLGTLPCLDNLNLSYNQLSGELLFSGDFFERLGKRLDVRGNNGLCISNLKNISAYLETPACLNATSEQRNGRSKSLDWEHPNESRMKPSKNRLKESSGVLWLHPNLISFGFMACFLSFLM